METRITRVSPEQPNPPKPPNITRKSPDLARKPTIDAFSLPAASLSSGLDAELMSVHWNTPALASLHSSACVSGLASAPVPPGAAGFLISCQGAAVDATPFGASLSNAGVMLTQ